MTSCLMCHVIFSTTPINWRLFSLQNTSWSRKKNHWENDLVGRNEFLFQLDRWQHSCFFCSVKLLLVVFSLINHGHELGLSRKRFLERANVKKDIKWKLTWILCKDSGNISSQFQNCSNFIFLNLSVSLLRTFFS